MGVGCSCRSKPDGVKSVVNLTRSASSILALGDAALLTSRLETYVKANKDSIPAKVFPLFQKVLDGSQKEDKQVKVCLHPLSAQGFSHLCKILPFYTHCQSLTLWKVNLASWSMDEICSRFELMPSLKVLALPDNDLHDPAIVRLVRTFKFLPALKELRLCANEFTAAGANVLSQSLPVLKRLTVLSMDFNYVGASGCSAICAALTTMRRLQSLGLRANEITDDAEQSLLDFADVHPPVSSFDLQSNRLSPAVCERLIEAFADVVDTSNQLQVN